MARMKVAPPRSVPHAGSKMSFDSHFSAPFETESGPTLARLRKQRSAEPGNDLSQCSQSWTHACGCVLPGVQLSGIMANLEKGKMSRAKHNVNSHVGISLGAVLAGPITPPMGGVASGQQTRLKRRQIVDLFPECWTAVPVSASA